MWGSGNTAIRMRHCMELMARKMGFDAIAISLSLDSITASVRHSRKLITVMRVIGPPGINASRIGELEELARSGERCTTSRDIAARLAEIGSMPLLYSSHRLPEYTYL